MRTEQYWGSYDDGPTPKQVGNCASKDTYDTEAEARAQASLLAFRFGERLRPYECDVCGYLHLTSAKKVAPDE